MSVPISHTCPKIDEYIRELEDMNSGDNCPREIVELAVEALEYLRECNSKLRSWGEDIEEELSKEIDNLRDEIEHLKSKELD